jgi:hypothetical protein
MHARRETRQTPASPQKSLLMYPLIIDIFFGAAFESRVSIECWIVKLAQLPDGNGWAGLPFF